MGCVYMWTNNVNGKKYVGKTHRDVQERSNEHMNGHGSVLLKRSLDKYGVDNFTFEILHDGVIDAFLNDYEIEAIRVHNSKAPYGYNLTGGGDGMFEPSEETLNKISKALKGKKRNAETKQKMSEAQRGKKHSDETRRKLSEAAKSEKNIFYGKKLSAESIQKMAKSKRGKKLSKEHCQKLSEARKGKIAWNRSPHYTPAREMFISLSDSLTLSSKREILRKNFPKVDRRLINTWVRRWLSEFTD